MKQGTPKGTYVQPELGHARIDAQWARVSERLPAQPMRARSRVGIALAFSLSAAAVGVFAVSRMQAPADSVWEGSVVASEESPVDFTLAEGTRIELEPRSKVQLLESTEDRVQLELTAGGTRLEVAKKKGRRFSVRTGPVVVRVTGTQFRVARFFAGSSERVNVEVFEGRVEVQRDGQEPVTLNAGESWSSSIGAAPVPSAAAEPSAPTSIEAAAPPVEASEPAQEDVEIAAKSEPHASKDEPPRPKPTHEAPAASADQLFDRANVARRAGRTDEAAAAFAALVERHPTARHAALAAFELGRIRMDAFGDAKGAVAAFERSLAIDPTRAFAEDALARLALAYDAAGDEGGCRRARERYLARYPDGVHAQHLTTRCQPR